MPKRILIVDNYPNIAGLVRHWMTRSGREVQVVSDKPQALRAAQNFKPELILIDIDIPAIDGVRMAEEIRQQPWGREMVIVAASGYPQGGIKLGSTFNAFLPRPIDYAEFAAVLAEWFPNEQKEL